MGKLPALPIGLAPTRTRLLFASSLSATTTTTTSPQPSRCLLGQIRHATFIPRPRRPYTFTQLVQLSDGSTYTARTTSPLPIYRAAKDTRNTLLWQPSEKSLRNVELDEAGKLAAFRERFGRAYDAASQPVDAAAGAAAAAAAEGQEATTAAEDGDDGGLDFEDLIAEFAPQDTSALKDSGPKRSPVRRK